MMIDKDTVVAWTKPDVLTRFHRDGTRRTLVTPFSPVASHVDWEGMWLVDPKGTTHRYSFKGECHESTRLARPVGLIHAAEISADGATLALLLDRVKVYRYGVRHRREITHRDWRLAKDHSLALSADGGKLAVQFEHGDDAPKHGLFVYGQRGTEHRSFSDEPTIYALAPNGRWIASRRDPRLNVIHVHSVPWAIEHEIVVPRVVSFAFLADSQLAIIAEEELWLVDLDRRRVGRIEVPELFTEVAIGEHDAVAIHPELGAWWLPLADFASEDLP